MGKENGVTRRPVPETACLNKEIYFYLESLVIA